VTTFVLVHPAWFGSWCWRDVAALLRAAGHDVHAPTLTGLGERAHLANSAVTLSTHVADVVNLIIFEGLERITLVGNSSGGTVITAAADRIPERIERIVYLDAFVPSDGESTRDLLAADRWAALQHLVDSEGDGWLLPRWGAGALGIDTSRRVAGDRRREVSVGTSASAPHTDRAFHRTGTGCEF